MERALSPSQETGIGSYARFTGVFRILEVGSVSGGGSLSQDGSYIIQAKGKHTGGGGSPDPAICLYLAKPVYGTSINADKQVAFDIYAERILELLADEKMRKQFGEAARKKIKAKFSHDLVAKQSVEFYKSVIIMSLYYVARYLPSFEISMAD